MGWGGGFLEGFLEEETLPLGLDGWEPGKGEVWAVLVGVNTGAQSPVRWVGSAQSRRP